MLYNQPLLQCPEFYMGMPISTVITKSFSQFPFYSKTLFSGLQKVAVKSTVGCSFTQKIFTHEKIIVTNAESISQYVQLFLGGLTEKIKYSNSVV